MRAALELFAERGFEQTTAGDIAERAGVTERTFFRHFADKREALFDGSGALDQAAYDAVLAEPAERSPFEAALAAIHAGVPLLEERREHAARRAQVLADNPSLYERELRKLAGLTEAVASALRAREVAEPTASLAAHSAVTVFQVAFQRWATASGERDLATEVTEVAAALRALS